MLGCFNSRLNICEIEEKGEMREEKVWKLASPLGWWCLASDHPPEI
jgi:hypothetical protein